MKPLYIFSQTINPNMDYEQQLYSLAPGFKYDKDEEWAIHLETKDRVDLERERTKHFEIKEKLDELNGTILRESDLSIKNKLENRKKKFSKKFEAFNQDLVLKVKQLKEFATQAKKRKAEEAAERTKRRKLIDIDLADPDEVEDVEDSYLPREFIRKPDEAVRSTSRAGSFQIPGQSPTIVADHSSLTDPYLEGVKNDIDIETLKKLKPLVYRHKCREDVLKALASFKARDIALNAMDKFLSRVNKRNDQAS